MAANVIQEFLVALGFKVDESSQKKVMRGVEEFTKAVGRLGTELIATTSAVAVGVARWAASLESLHFAVQRTGSSADQLKGFDLAARNFGASMEEAQGSVESLAAFLRNNPGGESFLQGWLKQVGASTRDNNGHLRSSVELLGSLGKLFQQQRANGQGYLANQLAGQLGISPNTMLAMSTPGFQHELEMQQKRAQGWDAITKAAHRFEVQLQDLKQGLYQILFGLEGPVLGHLSKWLTEFGKFAQHHGRGFVDDIAKAVDFLIDKFTQLLQWLDSHGKEIQSRIQETFGEIAAVYRVVRPAMDWLYGMFVKLDEATDGWSTKILAATAALKLLGATGLVTGLGSIAFALAKGFGNSLKWASAASMGEGAWAVAGTAFGAAAALAIGSALGALLDHYFPNNPLAKAGSWLGGKAADIRDFFVNDYQRVQLENLYRQLYKVDQLPAGLDDQIKADQAKGHTIQQETNIIVQGALHADADTIARAIAFQQQRVNAEIIREFAPDSR